MQVPIIYAGVNGLVRSFTSFFLLIDAFPCQLDSIAVDQIVRWEAEFRSHLASSQSELLEKISSGNVTEEVEKQIKKVSFSRLLSPASRLV